MKIHLCYQRKELLSQKTLSLNQLEIQNQVQILSLNLLQFHQIQFFQLYLLINSHQKILNKEKKLFYYYQIQGHPNIAFLNKEETTMQTNHAGELYLVSN